MTGASLHQLPPVDASPSAPAPVAPLQPANEPMRFHEWLTAPEAAEYLRLPSTKALYQRAARGQIKTYRLGARLVRFRRRDLDALMRPASRTEPRARVESQTVCAVARR